MAEDTKDTQKKDEAAASQAQADDKKAQPEEASKGQTQQEPASAKQEEKKEEKQEEKKEVEVPEKFKKLVEEIEKMSVLELSELVKVLEEKFGVSAAAPVAVAGAVAGGAAAGGAGAGEEEKTSFDVILKEPGASKIQVIKVVRELTGKGLKESKDLVDAAPKEVKTGVSKEEAEEIKKKLEEAGATVELK